MDQEFFLDNACFNCYIKPSDCGKVADGLSCDICMNDQRLRKMKIGLEMPNIIIAHVTKEQIMNATTEKNFTFNNLREIPPKLDPDMERDLKRAIPYEIRHHVNRLVKHNVWYKYVLSIFHKDCDTINLREIQLVPYQDVGKPVVRHEQVFQVCVADWDGDCVLKDDINGVEIIKNAFSGDEIYDMAMIDFLPEHPVNSIFQIKYRDTILSGNTLELQLLVDLYYSNFHYI